MKQESIEIGRPHRAAATLTLLPGTLSASSLCRRRPQFMNLLTRTLMDLISSPFYKYVSQNSSDVNAKHCIRRMQWLWPSIRDIDNARARIYQQTCPDTQVYRTRPSMSLARQA